MMALQMISSLRVLWQYNMDLVPVASMAIALVCFAIAVYLAATGWSVLPRKKLAAMCEHDVAEGGNYQKAMQCASSPNGDSYASACHLIGAMLEQGRVRDAIALVHTRSLLVTAHVPANIAAHLLMAASQAPDFAAVMLEMRTFEGKFEPQSLEDAVAEAMQSDDIEACRHLHLMSGLLSIPISQHTFELLAQAYSADAAGLRALVEEFTAPLSKPFAKIVLEACMALKEVDLATAVFAKIADSDSMELQEMLE
jgi:hypothetical protein